MRRDFIVIHHSLTADGATVSWGAIEDYHKNVEHWHDIGYQYGVEMIYDRPYTLVGRSEEVAAAAVKEADMNVRGVHICFVGNFDLIPPPQRVLELAAKRIVAPLMQRHGITRDRVIGHRDAGLMAGFDWRKGEYKTCPGRAFDLDLLRRLL